MVKTGDIMVDEGLVCPEDVDQVLNLQKKNGSMTPNRGRLFGKVLCDLNLVTPVDNYCILDKHKKLVSIQSFLLENKMISPSRIKEIEAKAGENEIPFISYILEEDILSKPQLQQVLFDLFHIPFRSVSDIVFDQNAKEKLSGVIQKSLAAEHKVIPLQVSGNNLMVGITDPENLIFLKELDQAFPQYRFTPIFILFSGFTWFYKLLYNENWALPVGDPCPAVPVAFSIEVKYPDLERPAIERLYHEYEKIQMVGRTINNRARAQAFFDFIRMNHGKITREFLCRTVEFSLKKIGSRVLVMAQPKKEGR